MRQLWSFFALSIYTSVAISEPLIFDAKDEQIGRYVDGWSSNGAPEPIYPITYEAISTNGYRFIVEWANKSGGGNIDTYAQIGPYWHSGPNTFRAFYYDSTDCSGQPYILTQYGAIVLTASEVPTEPLPDLWYVPKDEEIQVRTPSSVRYFHDFESCLEPNTYYGESFASGRVFPNDPSETGVSQASLEPPLRLKASSESQNCIFSDSFECQ